MKANNLDEIRQHLNAVVSITRTGSLGESDEIKKVLRAIKDVYVSNVDLRKNLKHSTKLY
jgi:hypothetical protein